MGLGEGQKGPHSLKSVTHTLYPTMMKLGTDDTLPKEDPKHI